MVYCTAERTNVIRPYEIVGLFFVDVRRMRLDDRVSKYSVVCGSMGCGFRILTAGTRFAACLSIPFWDNPLR